MPFLHRTADENRRAEDSRIGEGLAAIAYALEKQAAAFGYQLEWDPNAECVACGRKIGERLHQVYNGFRGPFHRPCRDIDAARRNENIRQGRPCVECDRLVRPGYESWGKAGRGPGHMLCMHPDWRDSA